MLEGFRSWNTALPLLAAVMAVAGFDGKHISATEGYRVVLESKQRARPAIIIADLAYYSDDSVALLMLLRSGAIDVKAVITTAGNVCARQSGKDTHRLLQAVGAGSLPVIEGPLMVWHEARRRYYQNVEKPSWKKHAYAGALETALECGTEAGISASDTRAADFLIDTAKDRTGELVVVLQGPATVLGQALKKEPKLPTLLAHIYAMGGSLEVPGNVTKAAEFNVWFDPEAMSDLVHSGAAMTLVPLDATNAVTFGDISRVTLKGRGSAAEYLGEYLDYRRSRSGKARMWDEVLAAVVIDPSIVQQSQRRPLAVSTRADPTYGKLSVAPGDSAALQMPIEIITKVRAAQVRAMVPDLLVGKR